MMQKLRTGNKYTIYNWLKDEQPGLDNLMGRLERGLK